MSHSVEKIPDNVSRKTRLPRIFGVIALGLGSTFAITSDAGANYFHSQTFALKSGIEPRLTADPCTPTLQDYETETGSSERALTNLLQKVDNGGTVQASAELIPLDGKITSSSMGKRIPAKGYPIEIKIGNKTCFAFSDSTPVDQFGEVGIKKIVTGFNLTDVPTQYRNIPLQDASVINHELVGADGLLVGWAENSNTDVIEPGCNFESCA